MCIEQQLSSNAPVLRAMQNKLAMVLVRDR